MEKAGTQEVRSILESDRKPNLSLLYFMEDNPYAGLWRAGDSVMLRAECDRPWIYIRSDSQNELQELLVHLQSEDRYFAAIDEWMVPHVASGRSMKWTLQLKQFVLPSRVQLPAISPHIGTLSPDETEYIYENYEYRGYTAPDYLRERIVRGPTVAAYEQGELVGWAFTHDDGAMGFLQVLAEYRRTGIGSRLVLALSRKVRDQGRIPFAYIETENTAAIRLMQELGFVVQREVRWFALER